MTLQGCIQQNPNCGKFYRENDYFVCCFETNTWQMTRPKQKRVPVTERVISQMLSAEFLILIETYQGNKT